MSKKGILLILDGYGEGKANPFNAVKNANTPVLNHLKNMSYSLLKTDGEAVGLFDGEMGGSEVGHTTIGAGRVIPSTAKKIRNDIKDSSFEKNKNLVKIINTLSKNNGNLHLFGLMSDKNIHSDINHCLEIIEKFNKKVKNIFIHFITDGRDSGCYDSLKYLKLLNTKISKLQNCHISSVMGRFYAMDRENNLDRTLRALNAMFNDKATIETKDIEKYIKSQHNKNILDEYIEPVRIKTKTKSDITKKDCILFFNFREDRLRQIVKSCKQLGCQIATMASVGDVETIVLYENKTIENTLSQYLSEQGKKQIKISESTKYAHVTYFLNGGREQAFENEDRIHIPTIKIADFSKKPKMRAKEITKATLKSINQNYDAIIVNFSNADMVGHTGNYLAAVKAIEYLDKCVGKILKKAEANDYFVIITADHGNSEMMQTKEGLPHTAHTLNKVFCVVKDNKAYKMKKYGGLQDIAPTFVQLLGLKPSKYFEGKSLVSLDNN
ncbi:MAG: 2,3-bisphosphoglycerate-independent phosphoglycerate mutase [Clostridia bacterium]|nr:2,3-bisphosphoglycerate-independent phosphoglycerate mutase [Clostridia bacterium]